MTVLSGMSAMEHVDDNTHTMAEFRPLSDSERETLKEAAAIYVASGDIPCTGCGYCAQCPQGVDIPGVFAVYNYRERCGFKQLYRAIPENAQAHNCADCGHCLEFCPQQIDIPSTLRKVEDFAHKGREQAGHGGALKQEHA
jgi:predicted aldo/keto reductase-like oxidoreductase